MRQPKLYYLWMPESGCHSLNTSNRSDTPGGNDDNGANENSAGDLMGATRFPAANENFFQSVEVYAASQPRFSGLHKCEAKSAAGAPAPRPLLEHELFSLMRLGNRVYGVYHGLALTEYISLKKEGLWRLAKTRQWPEFSKRGAIYFTNKRMYALHWSCMQSS